MGRNAAFRQLLPPMPILCHATGMRETAKYVSMRDIYRSPGFARYTDKKVSVKCKDIGRLGPRGFACLSKRRREGRLLRFAARGRMSHREVQRVDEYYAFIFKFYAPKASRPVGADITIFYFFRDKLYVLPTPPPEVANGMPRAALAAYMIPGAIDDFCLRHDYLAVAT